MITFHPFQKVDKHIPKSYLSCSMRIDHINPSLRSNRSGDGSSIQSMSYYTEGILKRSDFFVLSEALTILESERIEHRKLALDILEQCYEMGRNTFRIGITGAPGVGKSTFIESILRELLEANEIAAVLTVDPSSVEGKGSILGDKTRMTGLVRDSNVFIRPSPSRRHLGGISHHTFEAIILCEAAGMKKIFVETVGTGQSETEVSNTTDLTILITLPGSGDSLQGIKKGVMEKADLIVVNKVDRDNQGIAQTSMNDLKEAMHMLHKDTIHIIPYSSTTKENQDEVLKVIKKIISKKKSQLEMTRKVQERNWLISNILSHYTELIAEQLHAPKSSDLIDKELSQDSIFAVFSKILHKAEFKFDL